MPIYEFECRRCGHVWDRLQRLSDPDPADCPQCQAAEVGRRMTAAGFRLKGAGWYETDFKGDKDKKRNLVEGSSGAPAEAASGEKKAADPGADKSPAAPAATAAPAPAPAPAPSGGAT